jgi:hypothetical protein
MLDDERVANLYLELAKSAQGRFNSRRDVEWKVTVALWTMYGAACGAVIGTEKIVALKLAIGLVILVALAIVVLYGLVWLRFLAKEFKRDQRTSYYWESGVQLILNRSLCRILDPGYTLVAPGNLEKVEDWIRMEDCPTPAIVYEKTINGKLHNSQWSQLGITTALAALFVVLVLLKWQ